MAGPRGPRGTPSARGRREDLVRAAAVVLTRDGVAATTTRSIATEAGLPLGALHYWFATKDDLLGEVARQHAGELSRAAADVAPDDDAVVEALVRLRAAFAVEQAAGRGHRLASAELLSWALRTPGREDVASELARTARTAAAGAIGPWWEAHAGEPGPQRDPAVLARLVAAVFEGLSTAELADPGSARSDEVLELFAELLGSRS